MSYVFKPLEAPWILALSRTDTCAIAVHAVHYKSSHSTLSPMYFSKSTLAISSVGKT